MFFFRKGWGRAWRLERIRVDTSKIEQFLADMGSDVGAPDELRRNNVQPAEDPVHLPRLVVQQ